MSDQVFSALIPHGEPAMRENIASVLRRFGQPLLQMTAEREIRIVPLESQQRYIDVSEQLVKLGLDVDGWAVPPAGLFVVNERTVYLRRISTMTIAHEFGHAIDCALGNGVYYSGSNPAVLAAFSSATKFVTPYAATRIDEYFAEAIRAYVECNDFDSPWPRVSRAGLHCVDPAMYAIVSTIFEGDA